MKRTKKRLTQGSGKTRAARTVKVRGGREPTQVRAEETRARILQKARDVFAEHGFDGANIRDIAQAANTTHSMITYHFGSKEQLWREAVRDMFELLRGYMLDVTAANGTLPLVERFKSGIRQYVRYCATHPEHARITIAETIRGGERLEWMVREFVKPAHPEVIPMYEEMMAQGLLPQMPMASFVYALVGMTQLPFVLAKESVLAFNYDMLSEQAIERHAEAVIALVLSRGRKVKSGT